MKDILERYAGKKFFFFCAGIAALGYVLEVDSNNVAAMYSIAILTAGCAIGQGIDDCGANGNGKA